MNTAPSVSIPLSITKSPSQNRNESQQKKKKKRQSHHADAHLHAFDVLVQSGETHNIYTGNRNLQHLIRLNIALYEATWSHIERLYVVQSIVGSIRYEGGRFLQFVAEWPRQTTCDENSDDCVWILKEMTEEQAESLTKSMLEDAIQRRQRQQQQEQHLQVETSGTKAVRPHDNLFSSSLSHRKPFQDLTTRDQQQNSQQREPGYQQLSYLDDDECGEILPLLQLHKDNFCLCSNEENNPNLANKDIPPPVLTISKSPTWKVSPIRNQRKRIREDDENNSSFSRSPARSKAQSTY